MIAIKIPSERIVSEAVEHWSDVDPELVEIAKSLKSFKGFTSTWDGREMEISIKAEFNDPGDAAFFKLSL